MSAYNYARSVATTLRLLERFGRAWQFTTTVIANATQSRTATGALIDEVRHDLGDSGVAIGDKRFMFEAAANPVKGERITAGSESYVIQHKEPIQPAAVVVAWWVWARNG